MPRGRPRKIRLEDSSLFVEKPIETKVELRKQVKVRCKCDLCGKDIYCSPVNINLTYLTGKASWHRFCADNFKVCDDCAEELSGVIDSFIIKKNKNMKRWTIDG